MFSAIYVEKAVRQEPHTQTILNRLSSLPIVEIGQYGEIFNRSNQNFRLQKLKPALILAEKHGNKVLPTPPGYGFEELPGAESPGRGYYFSHMLNCVYDCRYCFLQGMYRSANYVLFTNFMAKETNLPPLKCAGLTGRRENGSANRQRDCFKKHTK